MDAPNRLRSEKTSPKRDLTALEGQIMVAQGNALGLATPIPLPCRGRLTSNDER